MIKQIIQIVFFIFLLSSCFGGKDDEMEIYHEEGNQIIQTNQKGENTGNSEEQLPTLEGVSDENLKKVNTALDNLDQEDCSDIDDVKAKLVCQNQVQNMQIQFGLLGLEECNEIKLKSKKESCITEYYTKQALENNDMTICKEIEETSGQNNCESNFYDDIVETSNNADDCNKFSDEVMQDNCKVVVIERNAIALKDKNICKQMVHSVDVLSCQNKVIDTIVEDKGNLELCNNYSDKVQINQCISEMILSQAEKGNDLCSQTNDVVLQNQCKEKFAYAKGVQEKTLAYCDFEDTIQKRICGEQIVESLNTQEKTNQYCSLLEDISKLGYEQCKQNF